MAISTIEELKAGMELLAADLDAAGDAPAAYRIKAVLSTAFPTQNEFLEQVVDVLEMSRRVWLKLASGAKAMQTLKLSSAATRLMQAP